MDENLPRLHEEIGRGRHEPSPLLGREQSNYKKHAGQNKSVDVDEVPGARDTDRVTITGRRDHGRDITSILLRRPNAVRGYSQRRESDPFRARGAVIVEIEPRMFHQNGKTAPDEHEQEKEVKEMAPANPERKAMRAARNAFMRSGCRRNVRKTEDRVLRPGQDERTECEEQQRDQDRRTDPNSKAPIIRIIDRAMCLIEMNHTNAKMINIEAAARTQYSYP